MDGVVSGSSGAGTVCWDVIRRRSRDTIQILRLAHLVTMSGNHSLHPTLLQGLVTTALSPHPISLILSFLDSVASFLLLFILLLLLSLRTIKALNGKLLPLIDDLVL